MNFKILGIGMVFYGLGEAFRSGTHKAMILTYLEHKGWFTHKTFVYGRTRSYSLLGSSISAFLSILLVINLPALKWVFLVCIIPYLIDFVLIASYPAYLDEKQESHQSWTSFYKVSIQQLVDIQKNKKLQRILWSSASFDGLFKAVKDYIQPMLNTLLLTSGVIYISGYGESDYLIIYLGLIYGVFYIFSSIISKNVYRFSERFSSIKGFYWSYNLLGVFLMLLGFSIFKNYVSMSIFVFFIIYIMKDGRRPLFVDVCSEHMTKNQRATVLSIESQIRALILVIIAPLFGWIVDVYSMEGLFVGLGIILLSLNRGVFKTLE